MCGASRSPLLVEAAQKKEFHLCRYYFSETVLAEVYINFTILAHSKVKKARGGGASHTVVRIERTDPQRMVAHT
jgi:hypothetical protein